MERSAGKRRAFAERTRARGISYFPHGADDAESWYEAAPDAPDIIEIAEGEFGLELQQMWQAQGYPELADLAEGFHQLARELDRDGPP